ncbi:MAG: terminase small subunit [Candidatus Accumulibacter sp.]|jgi:phage terminase small subunit|nr:terminase small subunit [Accumulibacter sp.]
MKLTPKQQRFVDEYLIDLNATQAAIRAGYSEKTANEQGPRMLVKVSIQKAIGKAREVQSARINRTADAVLKDIHDTAVEARENGDLRTALKGYELEGKHLGLFEDRLKVSGGVSIKVVSEFPDD